MAERIKSAGHGKSRQLIPGLESFFSQRYFWPVRLALVVAALVIAFLLGALFFSYGSKLFEDWQQNRLLHQAAALLQEGRLSEASQTARELLGRHPNSLPALYVLAEAAEKQNLEEALWWREQIARLLPKDPDSQLNFASAALRFGKLDLAREVSPGNQFVYLCPGKCDASALIVTGTTTPLVGFVPSSCIAVTRSRSISSGSGAEVS